MSIRLVAIDLDGTLVGSDLKISDADRRAIARVIEQRPRFSADVMHGRRIAPNVAHASA